MCAKDFILKFLIFSGIAVGIFLIFGNMYAYYAGVFTGSRQLLAFVVSGEIAIILLLAVTYSGSKKYNFILGVLVVALGCWSLNRIPEFQRISDEWILQDDRCFIKALSYHCSEEYLQAPDARTYYLEQIEKMTPQVEAQEDNYRQWLKFVQQYCHLAPNNGYEFGVSYEECIYAQHRKKLK